MKNIIPTLSRIASLVFHPLLIPTWGFLLLSNSGFYFAVLPWSVKKFMLLVILLFTCLLPALSIGLMSLSPRFDLKMEKSTDRIIPLIISSICYYLGYLVLERMPLFPLFNLFLVASILVQIALIFVSLKWKISAHSAAIGGLTGGFMAMSFRLEENPVLVLSFLILAAGLVGTSRLVLLKHTRAEVYAGFSLGYLILDLIVTYI